ncbi:hypothetical protein, partial [Klebsiella pneumoniae]|uniref:hypothetical protein n=2 Tax=Pseudomonadota TaxID=1224 RepID=UPI00356A8A21
NGFAAVRDGVGQGLFQAGTPTTPAIRNAGDQDTGLYWPTQNAIGMAIAGLAKVLVNSDGLTVSNGWVNVTADQLTTLIVTRNNVGSWFMGGSGTAGDNTWNLRYNSTPMLTVDVSGNLLVGVTSGSTSRIAKPDGQAEATKVFGAGVASGDCFHVYSAFGNGGSSTSCTLKVHAN